jgi:hypothetical protein
MLRNLFVISIAVLFMAFSSKSEEIDKKLFPLMLGATNSGTEFFLTFHPGWEYEKGKGIRIYVSSAYETKVTLEIKNLGISIQKMTKVNDVIEFELNSAEALVYTKTDKEKPQPEQIWKGRAIKITSEDPIIVYAAVRFYAVSDGYMALPVSGLGTRYQVASYADPTNNSNQFLPSYTSIIGAHDNTKVTFKMGGCESCFALKSDGGNLRFNETISRTLNEGDVWLIPGIGPFNDLTGSTIRADKPVAVISGSFCAYIPSHVAACDYIIEQELPEYNWGKKYFVIPIKSRKAYPIVKLFASERNTTVLKNDLPFAFILNPGGITGSGFIETRAGNIIGEDKTVYPATFTSDLPINVVLFNTGSQDDGVESDPFQMQIIPCEQFQTDITFSTPGIKGGVNYKNNFLNIIYLADSTENIPDDLMWGEAIDGKFSFIKMKNYSMDMGVEIPFSRIDNRSYRLKTIKLQNDGVYRIKAKNPLAAYAYGSDYYDGYGLPLAGRLKDLTIEDSTVPILSITQDSLGNLLGYIEDKGDTKGIIIQNGEEIQVDNKPSGLSVASLLNALSYNYKFTSENFIPGIDNFINFRLKLINRKQNARAVLGLSDRRGNDTIIVFNYTAPAKSVPTIAAQNTNFGIVKSSKQVILPFNIENNSALISYPVKRIIFENNDPQFEIVNNIKEGTVLSAGEKYPFSIQFTAKDLILDSISIFEKIFLNKIGIELMDGDKIFFTPIEAEVANPRIELNNVNFSAKKLGETYTEENIYVKNISKNKLNITKITVTGDDVFKFTFPQDVSPVNPVIVEPNSDYTFKVNFEPKTPGQFEAKLDVESDGVVIKKDALVKGSALPTTVNDNELVSDDVNVIIESGALSLRSKYDYNLTALEIYDLSGRLITNDLVNSQINNYKMRLSGFSAGVYIVKMKINGNWVSKKFSL